MPVGNLTTLRNSEDFNRSLTSFLTCSKSLAVLLDYDGTLAPIASHPNDTRIPSETETHLKGLVKRDDVFIAVISGRGVDDVRNKINIDNVTYAGNHGLEILYPDGSRYNYPIPEASQANYTKMVNALNTYYAKDGAWVENKGASLTFHYRSVPENQQDRLKHDVIKLIEDFGFRANQAHMAIEAKPPVEWNKGKAALFILQNKFGEDWNEKVKVLFAGDDTTDEDAMKALKGQGISFRIAHNDQIQTFADYRLESPFAVGDLLKWLITKH
ncbi:Trehalose 6-phosphate phosphatase [Sergentomyia squamirostris]